MADITRINEILADVLAALHGTVPELPAREFLISVLTATLRLEQHDMSAGLVPPLMAALMGQFIGDQEEATRQQKRDLLQMSVSVLFHAYAKASGDDELIREVSSPKRNERRARS